MWSSVSWFRSTVAFLVLLPFLPTGCSNDGSGLDPPLTSIIRVSTSTSGLDLDPDGYSFAIDANPAQPIGLSAVVAVADIAAGDHAVLLSGLAPNCQVQGENPRQISVAAGATVTAGFSVSCGTSGTSSISVSTSTDGNPMDADGYTLLLDGSPGPAIGVNGTATLSGVAAGDHRVELSGMDANCRVDGDNPRTVSVAASGPATAAFVIHCGASGGSVAHWTSITPVVSRTLEDIWGSSANDMYAVGFDKRSSAGTIIHFDGTTWSSEADLKEIELQSVWGAAPNDIYAVGSHLAQPAGAIMHFDGNTWTETPGPAITPGNNKVVMWRSVWGSSGQDVFALGASYGVLKTPTTGLLRPSAIAAHYDGHTWTTVMLPAGANRELLDAWGTSPSNVYLVGDYQPGDGNDEGVILHYDGASWTETRYGSRGLHLKAIWGTGANDIFTVGDDGTVLHFDGNVWTPQPTPITKAVHELWGSSGTDVTAVAARGIILHYDGTRWTQMVSPTKVDLFGVWGSGPGNIFATGVLGVILHGTP
jgi:hypothetical protein